MRHGTTTRRAWRERPVGRELCQDRRLELIVTANYMMNGDQPQCAARTVLMLASREEAPMRESQGLRSRQPRSIEIRTSLREDYSDVYTATALAAIEALAILDDDRKEVIALRTE